MMGPVLRSLSYSARRSLRSLPSASAAAFRLRSPPPPLLPFAAPAAHRIPVSDCSLPLMLSLRRTFSVNTSQLPHITDPDIESAFKDLMAMSWDELPDSLISETKKALSKSTDDKAGQEALANIFRAAEASVEFGAVLVSLRMALDDLSGVTGENVAPLPAYLEDAVKAAYRRYMTYLDSFGPDEAYLRKKVETELGTKMIHLKMRCSGIGSEWGKITLLGTSGISGSYVEQRA
ncbi:succinate dehydrogenase subunit 5, mitochondrial-like [Iris pallida]|uniref:Succinate dehydrogenase subunit 5, mitochondrial-like n=1 Tax=Iris pallida TaxID=29817 RepID=A0AAX6GNS4_IRIPA|nr:succinate dehydrogenase subunit 5, mitochondrial-like [Iris pallida]KAJ6830162.1 succinate dehydrogenase subunit 5, mitochondrial-like [Iris pallida]